MKPDAITAPDTNIQQPLMMFVPIADAGNLGALRDLLTKMGATPNPTLDFGKSPSTHFARFVLLEKGQFQQTSNRLLFTANFDGDRLSYLKELADTLGTELNKIWSLCGVDRLKSANFQSFADECSAPINTFYVALPGVSARNVLSSAKKREAKDAELNILQSKGTATPSPVIPPPSQTTPAPNIWSKIGDEAQALVQWLVGIRAGQQDSQAVVRTQSNLYEIEDLFVQNQMTVIVAIKKGLLSRLILPIVLWAVTQAAKNARGSLSGITTIHFARWAIIDGGDNLLFESNYDGSWESYIDDFVDSASVGMNLIWGNCAGFPLGGSRDIEAFKAYIRANQIPSQLFYSAYPELTMTNILTDLGLSGEVPIFARPNADGQFKQGVYAHG